MTQHQRHFIDETTNTNVIHPSKSGKLVSIYARENAIATAGYLSIRQGSIGASADIDAIADSSGIVTGITINDGGSNYSETNVVFTPAGAGSNAEFKITVTGGVITAVEIIDGGSGYTVGTNQGAVTNSTEDNDIVIEIGLSSDRLDNLYLPFKKGLYITKNGTGTFDGVLIID